MVVGEGEPHSKAKLRLFKIVSDTDPEPVLVDTEYQYSNPFNKDYPWRFDCYFEVIYPNGNIRKVALEVDDKFHNTYKSRKKREHKIEYLKTKGIELFAWPRKWIIGKDAYEDQVFLEELHLKKDDRKWFNR